MGDAKSHHDANREQVKEQFAETHANGGDQGLRFAKKEGGPTAPRSVGDVNGRWGGGGGSSGQEDKGPWGTRRRGALAVLTTAPTPAALHKGCGVRAAARGPPLKHIKPEVITFNATHRTKGTGFWLVGGRGSTVPSPLPRRHTHCPVKGGEGA